MYCLNAAFVGGISSRDLDFLENMCCLASLTLESSLVRSYHRTADFSMRVNEPSVNWHWARDIVQKSLSDVWEWLSCVPCILLCIFQQRKMSHQPVNAWENGKVCAFDAGIRDAISWMVIYFETSHSQRIPIAQWHRTCGSMPQPELAHQCLPSWSECVDAPGWLHPWHAAWYENQPPPECRVPIRTICAFKVHRIYLLNFPILAACLASRENSSVLLLLLRRKLCQLPGIWVKKATLLRTPLPHISSLCLCSFVHCRLIWACRPRSATRMRFLNLEVCRPVSSSPALQL